MEGEQKTCGSCGAGNPAAAPWCGQCLRRVDVIDGAEVSPPSGARDIAAPEIPSPEAAELRPAASQPRWLRSAGQCVIYLLIVALLVNGRLVRPPALEEGSGDPVGYRYSLVAEADKEPVRYDPCSAIHYVINPAGAPEGGVEDVHTAVERTSSAMGVEFIYDGETDETYTATREPYQPSRYGERWAPVAFSWTAGPLGTMASGRAAVGLGGSTYTVNGDGTVVYVTGQATFDPEGDLSPGFGGQTWGQVMLHEVGHVVGLDHTEEPGMVMNPVLGMRSAQWTGPEKLALWELGIGRDCLDSPRLPG